MTAMRNVRCSGLAIWRRFGWREAAAFATALVTGCVALSCGSGADDGEHGTGLLMRKDLYKFIPADSIFFKPGGTPIPGATDLSAYFPPIGDQGAHGTCVGWAAAYNMGTALSALDNKFTESQLADPANQESAEDLYLSIPNSEKAKAAIRNNLIHSFFASRKDGVVPLAMKRVTNDI